MSYFRTSYATLKTLAASRRFEDVAGFLVLARHATGLRVAGFEPYKLSGAGANSVHDKAGVSEETARGVIERLKEQGRIKPVSDETRSAHYHARWEIVQGPLDLDLPHAFVDPPKNARSDYSSLRRLKAATVVEPRYAQHLTHVSDTELKLDALMLLLAVYRNTGMEAFGGLDPRCIFRKWEVKSQTQKLGGIRWGAEPDHKNTAVSYTAFMAEALEHTGLKVPKKGEIGDELRSRFWHAWSTLTSSGLVYEAVSLFDTAPTNEGGRLRFTLRVNDFHAGSATKTGDPSLLRTLETTSGAKFAYYTPAANEREEPEAMWVVLPDKRGALVGIWRPRFRTTSKDVGAWLDKEEAAIAEAVQRIEALAPAD